MPPHITFPSYLTTSTTGIAHGSSQPVHSILALNIRTEIAFGYAPQLTDGCTAASWLTEKRSWLGQNWDWNPEQQENLVLLTIMPTASHGAGTAEAKPKPLIKMVTEAGIIGKIGMNSYGVGVCLNAIRTPGMDASRMPVHLGLRTVLESHNAKEAIKTLKKFGLAAPGHMLIADGESGGYGVEFTSSTIEVVEMDEVGRVCHTNHLIKKHDGVDEPPYLRDSPVRLRRVMELSNKLAQKEGSSEQAIEPSWEEFSGLFSDHKDGPGSICRHCEPPATESATLFTIVMELKERRAVVRLGRPCGLMDTVVLSFD